MSAAQQIGALPPAALYYQLGLAPIAVEAGGKKPIGSAWQDATIDAPYVAAVDEWIAQGGNVGIRNGVQPSGKILGTIDVDGPPDVLEAFRAEHNLPVLPPTLSQSTPGGSHLIFTTPAPLKNRVGLFKNERGQIDLRGQNGQIVVPPSRRREGGYAWANWAEPALLPDEWVKALANAKAVKAPPVAAPVVAMAGAQILNGSRNDTLFRLASSLRARGAEHATIRETLERENVRCLPPLESSELDTIAGSAARFPKGFASTDLGNAERLIARHGGELRFCAARDLWLAWDGRRWAADDTGEIVRRAKDTVRQMYADAVRIDDDDARKALVSWARTSEAVGKLTAMVKLAESEPGVPVRLAELDADPWLFNVENGTIDLRNGVLRPHRRTDLVTKLAPVAYDPTARSELWEGLLSTATGKDADLSAYLRRAVGYALQGTTAEKAFFFLYGPPDGSKSTIVDAIMGAFGDYAVSAAFTTWLVQHNVGGNRGDLVRLAGTRLVSSVEVRPGARFDQEILKKVTGGDAITAAAKFENEVSFPPSFALWLAANDAPAIRDDDEGMWNRVRRIPFVNVIPKADQDPALRTKLAAPDVRAAILTWAVQGCLEWQSHGLGTCAAVEASNKEYRQAMDRGAAYIEQRLCFDPSDPKCTVSAFSLRTDYEAWCREEGVRTPLTGKELGARLQAKGATPGRIGGARAWAGVKLAGAA